MNCTVDIGVLSSREPATETLALAPCAKTGRLADDDVSLFLGVFAG